MAEREVVLDKPVVMDEEGEALRKLTERAEAAEAELAKLKGGAASGSGDARSGNAKGQASDAEATKSPASPSSAGDEQTRLMLRQVEGRDYNPPKRARIVEWQAQQEFPILPNPEDPDCGNLYRNLKFPEEIYSHIGQYQEKKMEAGE